MNYEKTRMTWMELPCVILTALAAFVAVSGGVDASSIRFTPGDKQVKITFTIPSNSTAITKYAVWVYDENGNDIEGIGGTSKRIDVRDTTQIAGQNS